MANRNLSESSKGMIELALGIALLLYVLGTWVKLFNSILIVGSIALMVHGFMRVDGYEKIKNLIAKK